MPAKEAGVSPRTFWWVVILIVLLVLSLGLKSRGSPPPSSTAPAPLTNTLCSEQLTAIPEVDVVVSAENANAFDPFDVREVVLRVSNSCSADNGADGQLRVRCPVGESIRAWAPGYEIKSVPCDGNVPYKIVLSHLDAVDYSYYAWSSALNDCNTCHGNQFMANHNGATYNEMNEWLRSGHGRVFEGGYFETMYKGTSVTGKNSIPAQPVIIDNEWVPVPPEISHLYHGPGFKLDFPSQPGNCAFCHVPTAVQGSQEGTDLSYFFPNPGGSWGEGVTCDVCHKVFEVTLADNQLPFADRPGILSYRFMRPIDQVFITGPFSNILTTPQPGLTLTTNHHATCTPLFSQSEFCAPCHYGKFKDMVVYNSYGEWKQSGYASNPADPNYRTCQDCHMSGLYKGQAAPSSSQRQACSANNTAFQNFDHNMMDFGPYQELLNGTTIEIPRMIKGAAQMEVAVGSKESGTNALDVNVTVTNKKAGHKFPTDSPLRHLILVVSAVDRVNTPLIQVAGGRIPNWAGPGPISPANIVSTMDGIGIRDYGGSPGKIFANLLVEEETNLSPGIAYWNEMKYAAVDTTNGRNSDTRLVPGQPDLSSYSFTLPDEGNVRVTVDLIYRYAFYDLVVWKEWFNPPRADILVSRMECEFSQTDPSKTGCRQTEPPTPTPTPTSMPTSSPSSTPTP